MITHSHVRLKTADNDISDVVALCCLLFHRWRCCHRLSRWCSIIRLTGAGGLQVVSTGPQTVLKAEGDSVVLGCKYRSSLRVDSGDLDVEWSALSPDSTHKDQMLLSFSGGITYTHDQVLGKGLSFTVTDPSQGDASLSIAALTPAHSATYQCKVKKAPGVDTRKVTLMVLVKPSEPQCWLEGDPWVGRAAALQCHSNTGSSPLKYSWRREGGVQLPVTAKQNSVSGELKITNLTLSSAGFYFCEVNNAVGAERCRINLRAMTPPNSSAVIVGIVVGSLLLIFILLVFISLIYWKLSSRWHHEKEFSNDIRYFTVKLQLQVLKQ
uniref:Ig-like domain-containing protein n=1 Tax=Cynoglossus semilaevis TaxID=244447 RepID=A0A3P8V499_CYNSE